MGRTDLNRWTSRGGPQRRKAARYQASGLPAFNFGEVVDLSATGMRVRRPGKPIVAVGGVEKFVLVAGAGPISLKGKVVWVRGPSIFSRVHEYGVHFLNVDGALKERLIHVGQYGFDSGPAAQSLEDRGRQRVLAQIEVEDLYPILGVSPNASREELATAYRALVRRWHPDVCKEPGAAEELARGSKAYRVLRDPELRAKYDEMRASAKSVVPPTSTPKAA